MVVNYLLIILSINAILGVIGYFLSFYSFRKEERYLNIKWKWLVISMFWGIMSLAIAIGCLIIELNDQAKREQNFLDNLDNQK